MTVENALLLALWCLVSLVMGADLLRRDLYLAAAYFYLFLYGIFAVVGYSYFPELSMRISAYFGPQIIEAVLIFMVLSFVTVYCGFMLALRVPVKPTVLIGTAHLPRFAVTAVLLLSVFAAECAGLEMFGDQVSYSSIGDATFLSEAPPFFKVWFVLFKTLPVVLTVLYATIRYGCWPADIRGGFIVILCLCLAGVFMVISYRAGNRGDAVSLFNAFVFVEVICQQRRRAEGHAGRSLWGIAAIGIGLLAYLSWLAGARTAEGRPEQFGILQALIAQDYYAPAHILFAAVAQGIVNPLEVIWSNTANALVLMDHPYLQQTIADTFNPGVSSRSSSYAFYLLSEGYLAMGDLGFVYNGLIVTAGFYLWRRLASTSSPLMDALLLPILALDLTNMARGQSAYFVKYLYFHVIPALVVIYAATGMYARGLCLRVAPK